MPRLPGWKVLIPTHVVYDCRNSCSVSSKDRDIIFVYGKRNTCRQRPTMFSTGHILGHRTVTTVRYDRTKACLWVVVYWNVKTPFCIEVQGFQYSMHGFVESCYLGSRAFLLFVLSNFLKVEQVPTWKYLFSCSVTVSSTSGLVWEVATGKNPIMV